MLKGGVNVLYIEGAVRVEQKFIRRALDASRDIHVDYVRHRPPARRKPAPPTWPSGSSRASTTPTSSATSIRRAFRESELQQLAETVNNGAGLIMLGGFHSFGPGALLETPLADVLPVVMDRLDRQGLDDPMRERPALARPAGDAADGLGPAAFRPDAGRRSAKRTWRCGRSCRRWKGPTSS